MRSTPFSSICGLLDFMQHILDDLVASSWAELTRSITNFITYVLYHLRTWRAAWFESSIIGSMTKPTEGEILVVPSSMSRLSDSRMVVGIHRFS